jgi:hypothetical protein
MGRPTDPTTNGEPNYVGTSSSLENRREEEDTCILRAASRPTRGRWAPRINPSREKGKTVRKQGRRRPREDHVMTWSSLRHLDKTKEGHYALSDLVPSNQVWESNLPYP